MKRRRREGYQIEYQSRRFNISGRKPLGHDPSQGDVPYRGSGKERGVLVGTLRKSGCHLEDRI
jgi:hypothetical protein